MNIESWPDLCYPDIVNYVVYCQSAYTLAELKAYKSLQAYNYYIRGLVPDVAHVVLKEKSVFLAKVNHSQIMSTLDELKIRQDCDIWTLHLYGWNCRSSFTC